MAVNHEFLAEYQLCQKIHQNNKNIVYRGKHRDTLEPVILKLARNPSDRQQLVDYCHSYVVATELNLSSIVIPIDLLKSKNYLALVMPDKGYISLQGYLVNRKSLGLAEFFSLALAILKIVKQLEEYKLNSIQLSLEHILVSSDCQQIELINFSRSAIAFFPKQSQLSILNSLGLIFYRLLTGKELEENKNLSKTGDRSIPNTLQEIVNSLLPQTGGKKYREIATVLADLNLCWQAYQKDNNLSQVNLFPQANKSNDLTHLNFEFLLSNSDLSKLLIESSSKTIFWKDLNSVYLGCNRAFADLAGINNPQEIAGKTDYDLPWTKEEADWYRKCDRHIMERDIVEDNIIETQVSAEGRLARAISTKAPIHDRQGNVIGIFGSYRDITLETILKQQSVAMDVVLDGMAVLKDGKYIYLNQAHVEIFGYDSPEELLGKAWQTLYDASSIPELEAAIFPKLNQDRFWRGELIAKRKDGSYFEEELSLILTEDNLLVCVCRDISDRKAIERKLKFTRFAVQNSADSIFYIDCQGKIIAANRSASKRLGYSNEELCSLSVFDIDPSFSQPNPEIFWDKHWLELRQQKTITLESIHHTKEGDSFPVEIVANYLEFEGQEYSFARAIDISDRKQAEIAVIEELQRTQLFNQITQAIRQSLDTKIIFDSATREIRALLKADRACISRIENGDCAQGEYIAENIVLNYPSTLGVKVTPSFYIQHYESHYRRGKILAIADTHNSNLNSSYLSILDRFQVRAVLVIPLILQDDIVWGFLCVHQCSDIRQWQTSEIEFVQKIATQLCLAIQQAQSLEIEKQQKQLLKAEIIDRQQIEHHLEQRIKWEQLLTQMVRDIRQSLDRKTIFQTATKQIRENLNADRVCIFQFEPDSLNRGKFIAENRLPAYTSLYQIEVEDRYFARHCAIDFGNRGILAIEDVLEVNYDPEYLNLLTQWQVRANLILPLLQEDKLWGLLCVHQCSQIRQWQELEIQFLQKMAMQLDLSIYQAELLRQTEEQKIIQTKVARQQKVLTQIVRSIHLSLDLQQIYRASKTAIFQIKQLFNCKRITLYQFAIDSNNKLAEDSGIITLSFARHLKSKTISETDIERNPFAEQYARYHLKIIQQFQRQGYLTIPIFVEENIWGFVAAVKEDKQREWKLPEIAFLDRIASQLGVAFQQAQLLQKLQQAKQNADAANLAKSKFLASMSHELRTPLNAILGFSQLMQRDPDFNPQHRQTLKIINDSGEHLLNLINDVLEMSKIEAGKITLNVADFDLYDFLERLKKMLEQKAKSKQLRLDFACDATVPRYITGDEHKLRQVSINLLSNSLKFTQQGGVSLKVSVVSSQEKRKSTLTRIKFEFIDTGVGICEEELQYLFDPFYQSQAGVKCQEGTGLGLSIAQKFVELMGGTIEVESQVNRGTTVKFEIEVPEAQIITKSDYSDLQVIGIAPNSQIPKILVVEDRWESRQLLVNILESIGFTVKSANNGLEGLKSWREWQPDLILMDIQMPVMDGYQAIAKIEREKADREKSQDTIIIALTASAFQEDRDKILAVGGNEIIHKPFQESTLLATIAKYFELDFIYAETESEILPDDKAELLSDREITRLLADTTADWLDKLHSATQELDRELILESISQLDESLANLSHTLEILLDDFKFDLIADCIEQAIDRRDRS